MTQLPAERPPSFSRSELAEFMLPHNANSLGKVFGGVILSMVDKAAACAAIRHAGGTCVTAQVDQVAFHAPIDIGEMVRVVAVVTRVGRSSMEVAVDVYALNPATAIERHTNTCYVTMVAIDDAGQPKQVPRLSLTTDAEREACAAAEARMQARKAARAGD